MSRLPEIQGNFQTYLLSGAADAIERHVVGTDKVPVATRLSIYGDGYRTRLIEALEANFPVLAQLLGDEDFATLGTAYVRAHDSPFFNIRHYGNALADFLATDPGYAGAPVLAELARWEWTMTEVFDAADVESLSIEALARVKSEEWAELRFDWHPSLRRLALLWNAPQTWKAVSDDAEPPEVELSAVPVEWLLWRQDLRTYYRSLTPPEVMALDAARAGESFGELCGLLSAELGEAQAPARAAGFLRDWIESGLIIAVR